MHSDEPESEMRPSKAAPVAGDHVLRETTSRLRKLAVEHADGSFLGSESDLLQALQVSRPTLRQALRLLEHEQLVRMRRGPHGGCYAARPAVDTVVRAAATYLQSNNAPLREMVQVVGMLTGHVIEMAVAPNAGPGRSALAAFIDRAEQMPDDLSPETFHALETEFTSILRAMANNTSLDLFLQVAQRVIELQPESRVLITDPTVIRLRRRMWRQLTEAILAGDASLARQLGEQQLDLVFASIR